MSTKLLWIVCTALMVSLVNRSPAAAFNQAQVTQIQNDVRTIIPPSTQRPSKLKETITGNQSLRTGAKSRAELIFPDFSLTRLGANTIFSFQPGTRELELQEGTILFHVPKGSGGAKIRTAAINAVIAGTTGFFEYSPRTNIIKFGILEGTATLFIKGRPGHWIRVGPGEMVIVKATVRDFNTTEVVHFDIQKFVATSKLITEMGGLPELATHRISIAEVNQRRGLMTTRELTGTNLVIPGGGNQVFILSQIDQRMNVAKDVAAALPTPTPTPPAPAPTPSKFGKIQTIAGRYVIKKNTVIRTDPIITTNGVPNFGKIYRGAAEDGQPTNFVFGLGVAPDPVFDNEFAQLNQPAVFRFENLQVEAAPAIGTRGGPKDLVLAAFGAITSGGADATTLNLSNLQTLTFAALGPITLAPELTIQGLGTQLWLYNRGEGNGITVDSTIMLGGADLQINTEGELSINGNVTFANGDWNSSGDMQIQGSTFASGSLKLDSQADITLSEPITASTLDISGKDITASKDLNGTSISGRNLTFGGNASFTGDVFATESFIADNTFRAKFLDAAAIHFSAAGLDSSTLNQSDGFLTFAGPINTQIDTTRMTRLEVDSPLQLSGNISLDPVDLTLAGDVETLGTTNNISAQNLTVTNVNAINGGDIGLFATQNITIGGNITARNFVAEATRSISGGASPLINAVEVALKSGILTTFSQPAPSRINFGSLPIDLTRTTAITLEAKPLQFTGGILLGDRDLTLGGNVEVLGTFENGINAKNLDVTNVNAINGGNFNVLATQDITTRGNIIAGNVALNALGDISIGGLVTARDGITLFAFGSISGNPASSLIDGVHVFLRMAGEVSVSQPAANRVNFGSLPIDLTRTVRLNLEATSLQLTGSIDLGQRDLNLTSETQLVAANTIFRSGSWSTQGNMDLAGLTSASNSLELVAGGNISVTGSVFADQLIISATGEIGRGISTGVLDARILSLSSGQPAVFGAVSETDFLEFGPGAALSTVLIGETRLTNLNVSANPLQLTSSIFLSNVDLTLAGTVDAQANDVNVGGRDLTIGNLTNGGSIFAARILPANRGSNGSNSITTQAAQVTGALAFSGAASSLGLPPEDGSNLTLTFQSTTLPFDVEGENFNGGDALSGSGNVGGSGGTYFLTSPQSITTGVITATTGRNSNSTMTGGRGGTVEVTSESGSISVNFPIEVSSNDPGDRRRSASGGNIRLRSGNLTGTAINVTNSGDLRAFLDSAAPGPGGRVEIVSAGGQIIVQGKATADRGLVDIRNNGPAPSPTPQVTLTDAMLAADVVKVGALGNNGVLTVGGGSINADTTLKLYGGGSNGTVNFVENVTLGGNSVKTIAGRTVNITNTKIVTVNGPAASVFTDTPNYSGSGGNGSTTGAFGGSGASTLPFDHPAKPPFD